MAKLKKSEALTAEREKEIQQASESSLRAILKITSHWPDAIFLVN